MKILLFLSPFFILTVLLNYSYFTFNKTAIQIVDHMGIGYNLGKTYNCCSSIDKENLLYDQIKTYGTILPTKKIINKIKKYGFKTIRFQVLYTNLTDIINSEWLIRIKEIVDWIIKDGMYCILCVNHDKEFWMPGGQSSKNKYINFWKQVASQFIDNNVNLIFETLTDLDIDIQYLFDFNFTQDFIDTIRNSDGYNKERLLIIPELATELEINNYYDLDFPKDPSNKTAVSLHYYFPSETLYYYETPPLNWIDKYGFQYEAIPTTKWGSDYDYKEIKNKLELLKNIFIDRGIPVIIGEVGILSNYNNNANSMREFLHTFFSLTKEYNGIMACLWDNSEKISKNNNYYNRETDIWNDEIIKKNIFRISKDKEIIKSSDYYITSNKEILVSYLDFFYTNISTKKLLKIIINAKLYGILGIDFQLIISSINKENEWVDVLVTKKEGKKQYDGTTVFTIDVSKEDFNYDTMVATEDEEFEDNKFININNVTFEFEEYFPSFDFNSYRNSIIKDLN